MKYMVNVDMEGKVRCNNCMTVFCESEINYDEIEDKEFCPYCGASGCLMDM